MRQRSKRRPYMRKLVYCMLDYDEDDVTIVRIYAKSLSMSPITKANRDEQVKSIYSKDFGYIRARATPSLGFSDQTFQHKRCVK